MSTRGISLIELLAVLAITSVITGYALFWSGDWIAKKRANATVTSFAAAVHLARHTAIVGNVPVTFCPTAVDRCGPRNTWHEGAIIFVDHNRNRRIDTNDYRVKGIPRLTDGTRVYWRSFRNRSYLRFTAKGLTDWQNGNFLFCDERGQQPRLLILNSAGRMYFSLDSNRDGVHEDAQGRAVVCR